MKFVILYRATLFPMKNIEIRTAKPSDLLVIEALAQIIWREHYTPIIGPDQVEYMLAKYQSVAAMQEQINSGYSYYLMVVQEIPVGYLSLRLNAHAVFLSKIYVLKEQRGRGIARAAMNFVISETTRAGLGLITLTVNKNNTGSIHAYEKMGFVNKGSIVTEIGEGFVMDDFVMEMELRQTF
ncbi:MAG: GNAT family N-acetyltransferase [Flavobacteriaceae bacterium]|nr:GNAT family N-acetyltransferase [Flavobacteriaceae bacterium]